MLQSQRVLAGALMAALVFIGIALTFVLVPEGDALRVRPVVVVVQVAVAIVLHLVIEAVGYRVPPLPPGADAQTRDGATALAVQSSMVRRFALAEALAIGSIAYAFVVTDGGLAIYVVGGVLSFALMAVHVYPWRRPLHKVVASLESGDVGITPEMRTQLALQAPVPGIREL